MDIQTTAGTTLAITASLPATADVTGYAALTFTPISAIKSFGDFGPTNAEVTTTHVGDNLVRKFKGSRNNGNLDITFDLDADDAGQVLLIAAEASFANYSFELTYQDGSKTYFPGKVMSLVTSIGEADSMLEASATIGIDAIDGVGIVNDYA